MEKKPSVKKQKLDNLSEKELLESAAKKIHKYLD